MWIHICIFVQNLHRILQLHTSDRRQFLDHIVHCYWLYPLLKMNFLVCTVHHSWEDSKIIKDNQLVGTAIQVIRTIWTIGQKNFIVIIVDSYVDQMQNLLHSRRGRLNGRRGRLNGRRRRLISRRRRLNGRLLLSHLRILRLGRRDGNIWGVRHNRLRPTSI